MPPAATSRPKPHAPFLLPQAALAAEFAELPEKAQTKVRRILDAALLAFAARGFHGTAVPEIAAAAQVGTGTIYRYFADKAALVNALYQAGKRLFAAEVWAEVAPQLAGDMPLAAQFRIVWRAMAGFAVAHGALFRFMELHHHGAYLDAASHAASEAVIAPGRDFLAAGIAQGAIRDADPDLLGNLVWGALVGLAKGCAEAGKPLDARSIETAGDTLWAGLAAPARPQAAEPA